MKYPYEIFYVLNQRLSVLKGFKSPKVEGFVRESLAYKPLRSMFLFEPGSAKFDRTPYVNPPMNDVEALERVAPQIIEIYGIIMECVETNELKGLTPDLEEIAKKTRNEKIRQMTNACVKSLAAM